MKISMSSPSISQAEIDTVLSVLRTPTLSIGPQVAAFERGMARIAGVPHAVAVNSGTSGLHLAVIVSGIGKGDWVITTPFSFVASSNCLLYEGAVPIFVDVREEDGNIDPEAAAEAAARLAKGGERARRVLPRPLRRRGLKARRLKGILSVDVFGRPADYDRLVSVAKRHGLVLIEDACEAVGSSHKGRPTGSLGDVAVFAFYPNKQMTTGEGGVLLTANAEWAEVARSLRNQGRGPGSAWLDHVRLGYNYRLDELSAALGAAQVPRLPELIRRRSEVARWYTDRLQSLEQVRVPQVNAETTTMSWFVYVIRVLPPADRASVEQRLEREGIPTRRYFPPIHLQPFYMSRFGYRRGDFPVAEKLGDQSLALPFSSVMTEDQVEEVCRVLRVAVNEV
ncbi:MAG: DegT/DnrJ/EryC1/StrS family aminotransferase [Anaerolineales bacterium]|jgi:dTDP-4-amino-4,6-dideoxygalactose transaminase